MPVSAVILSGSLAPPRVRLGLPPPPPSHSLAASATRSIPFNG